MRRPQLLGALCVTLPIYLSAFSAQAAQVTAFGDDVSFTYDDATLFGEVTVIGNTFFFTPDNFSAESLNGAGTATANETLDIDIKALTDGFDFNTLYMRERGDYFLDGANSSVDVSGQFDVTSNTKLCGGLFPCESVNTFTAGTLNVQNTLTEWEVNETVDLTSVSGWGSDTDVSVTMENLLSARTIDTPSSRAFVEKKFGGVAISVNEPPAVIPVPAAVWLFGSGLLGLVGIARHKKT